MSDKETVSQIAKKYADERILDEANKRQFIQTVERKLERSHTVKPIQVFDKEAKKANTEVTYQETNKSRVRDK